MNKHKDLNPKIDLSSIKALTFDVFGTVVDWRTTIIHECRLLGKSKGINLDWAQFADAWRAGYAPAMNLVRKGELPWMSIDALHRMILEQLLRDFNIVGLSENEKYHLNLVWHRLKPWPDSVAGLKRLRKRFIVATLSNGNMALLVNMAKNAGLTWDCILSSELAKHYKPDKEVYQMAADLLGLQPEQVMMVAAHVDDLQAAKNVGFKTAFVLRPLEFGPAQTTDSTTDLSFDIITKDFIHMAQKLGV
ncbi:MAG TPA: haloacid dehalogenase type II [Thermodesulfobacteriota bacterium]